MAAKKSLPTNPEEIADLAKSVLFAKFWHDSFRNWQEDVVVSILSGKDTMYVAKTGGGKSACFQIPAILLPGTTIVVSPLKALMKDQVENLEKRWVHATYLNSDLEKEEYFERMANLMTGGYKLLYVSPEKLDNAAFREQLKQLEIPLFVIDEMDCIVSYGKSGFRQEYLKIGEYISEFSKDGKRPVIAAFTATADQSTKEFVSEVLRMTDYNEYSGVVFGKNISVEAKFYYKDSDKKTEFLGCVKKIDKDLAKIGGSCIIFCSSRKDVDSLHKELSWGGLDIGKFHAEHADSRRQANYTKFMTNKVRFMVCTNAFWRGIDKPDIRFVIHYGIPGSMQDYVQEIGRAGRDGKESKALLTFSWKDANTRGFIIRKSGSPSWLFNELIDFAKSEDGCRKNLINEAFWVEDSEPCWICDFCRGKEYIGKYKSVSTPVKKKQKPATNKSKTVKKVTKKKTSTTPKKAVKTKKKVAINTLLE